MDDACFRWPVIAEETIGKVAGLLRSGRIHRNSGISEGLEASLRDSFKAAFALPVCNGTAAALSAFHALGLGPGDELIAPPFTHWATVLPATQLGCRVVFADLEPDSLGLSPAAAERAITPATRCIVVSHMYGNPVNVEAFRELCDRRGLYLVEDLSHAPGATWKGAPIGSFGDLAFFSMQATKTICAGEGGVLLGGDPRFYARAVELGHPKRISGLPEECQRYARVGLGYKFTLSPILALLAWESLQRLPAVNALRREVAQALRNAAADCPSIQFPKEHAGAGRVYWQHELLVRHPAVGPAQVVEGLRRRGIVAGLADFEFLPDLPHFSAACSGDQAFPNGRDLRRRLLVLRPFSQRNEAALAEYLAGFRAVLSELGLLES